MADDTILTRRELEILDLLAEGLSNDEIAQRLRISPNTVKVHVRNIFDKMGVQSRTEATMEAVRRGWITVPGLDATAEPVARPAPPQPPLTARWDAWRTAALAVGLALAALIVIWPMLTGSSASNAPTDFTSDRGQADVAPAPRQDVARWTARAVMPTARSRAASALIDGRLYVVGGETHNGDSDALEVYDPAFDVWQSLPPRPQAARGAGAAELGGMLYVAGGCHESTALDRVDRFDPQSQRWETLPALPAPRCGLALVSIGDRLYALGGWDGEQVTNSTFVFDPASQRWESGPALPQALAFAGAVAFRDQIYVLGGFDGSGQTDAVWVFDPGKQQWAEGTKLPEPRAGLAVAAEGNSIYAIGGGMGDEAGLHERFDLNARAWSTIDSPRAGPWRNAVAAMIGPNMHVVGGWNGDFLNTHETYQASHLLFLPQGARQSE